MSASRLAVQIRDVRALRGDDANILAIWGGDTELTTVTKSELKSKNEAVPELSLPRDGKEQQGLQQSMPSQLTDRTDGVLQQARKYRNTFAEILVVGALL
jgi:potassium channel subfamily K